MTVARQFPMLFLATSLVGCPITPCALVHIDFATASRKIPHRVAPVVDHSLEVVPEPKSAVAGETVHNDDGTLGWQIRTNDAQRDFQHIADLAKRAHCVTSASSSIEIRGSCPNGPDIVIRADATIVSKLCVPDSDRYACERLWSRIGN